MRTKAIVHIGAPRSGSTSFQALLTVNRESLQRQGFAVPGFMGNNMEELTFLSYEESGPDRRWDVASAHVANRYFVGQLLGDDWTAYLNSVKEELADFCLSNQTNTVVLSAEGLYDRLGLQDIERFGKMLEEFNLDAEIVLIVRDPIRAHLSRWQADVFFDAVSTPGCSVPRVDGSNIVKSTDDGIELGNFVTLPPTYFYFSRLQLWQSVFPGRVRIEQFRPDIASSPEILRTVLGRQDIVDVRPCDWLNKSPSFLSLQVANDLNLNFGALLGTRLPNMRRWHVLSALQKATANLPAFLPDEKVLSELKHDYREDMDKFKMHYFDLEDTLVSSISQEDSRDDADFVYSQREVLVSFASELLSAASIGL